MLKRKVDGTMRKYNLYKRECLSKTSWRGSEGLDSNLVNSLSNGRY